MGVDEGGEDHDADAVNAICAFKAAPKFSGSRPGWAFKLGPQGLGYYRDPRSAKKVSTPTSTSSGSRDVRQPLRVPRKNLKGSGLGGEEDAYGELFPECGLGQ